MIPHNRAQLADRDGRITRDWYDWFRRLSDVFDPKGAGESILSSKQDKLVSGGNLKTINGESLLGYEDISIQTTLTSATASLGSAVALSVSGTWYDGPSMSLDAGTWLVTATASFSRSTATATEWEAKITDGVTSYSSGNTLTPAIASSAANIAMSAVITLTVTTAIKVQATTNSGAAACLMRSTTLVGSEPNATIISAVKIA